VTCAGISGIGSDPASHIIEIEIGNRTPSGQCAPARAGV
jgi:hypothetical protein